MECSAGSDVSSGHPLQVLVLPWGRWLLSPLRPVSSSPCLGEERQSAAASWARDVNGKQKRFSIRWWGKCEQCYMLGVCNSLASEVTASEITWSFLVLFFFFLSFSFLPAPSLPPLTPPPVDTEILQLFMLRAAIFFNINSVWGKPTLFLLRVTRGRKAMHTFPSCALRQQWWSLGVLLAALLYG